MSSPYPLAEAARGLGARRITSTTRREDLLISLEGVDLPEPAKFLADPFAQLRGADADRTSCALGRLGVALQMALGHDSIERIAVTYSTKRTSDGARFVTKAHV